MGMGMTRTSWRRRAATTVVAGASVIALAAPSVSAAPAGPTNFAGQAQATALNLTVLGKAVQQGTINQIISQTQTLLDSQGKIAAKADLLSGLLDQPALEFKGGKKSDRTEFAGKDLGAVKFGLGTMEYTADAAKGVTRAFSELANLKVGLSQAQADDLVDDVLPKLETLVGMPTDTPAGTPVDDMNLNQLLKSIETQVNQTPGAAPVDLPAIDLEDLPQVPNVTDLTDLVDIQKLWSDTATENANGFIVSTSEAGVVRMNLLGDLVKVPEFVFSSLAKTNGRPGGASAETVTKKLVVQLAGNDVIGISDGKLIIEGAPPLDLPELGLNQQLEQLSKLLKDILNSVGLSIEQAEARKFAAPDGSHAKATTSALAIRLSPLNAVDPNALGVNLELLPTASEVRGGTAVPAAQPGPPAAVQRRPSQGELPRTGGGAVAVLLGGLALGGAFALRRFTKS